PHVEDYIERTVHVYWDEEFCRNFRISRRTAYKLIDEFAASPMYPAADHGGSPAKSAEEHLLTFLCFVFIICTQLTYAANKACIRYVAGRFNLGESTLHGMMDRVQEFILSIGPRLIKFPEDLECLSKDFEEDSICDRHKRFLDVTAGHPSKVHDARVYRTSSIADKLPEICRRSQYHILGDAAFIIACFSLHNLCIEAGEHYVVEDPEDGDNRCPDTDSL
ncbi:hypothetical protein HPB47_027958, partial [Ixodes persulcatus]